MHWQGVLRICLKMPYRVDTMFPENKGIAASALYITVRGNIKVPSSNIRFPACAPLHLIIDALTVPRKFHTCHQAIQDRVNPQYLWAQMHLERAKSSAQWVVLF